MNTIEKKDSVVFLLPFKMKYFYLYNDEYFNNKNIHAKISVLMKQDASINKTDVIKGGGETEEKIKTLSVPYKYIYYVMEKIRGTLPSISGSRPQEKVSDEQVFNAYIDENKKKTNEVPQKKSSFFGMFSPFKKSEKAENIVPVKTEEPVSENKKTSGLDVFIDSETAQESDNVLAEDIKLEDLEEKQIDTTKLDELEKKSENLIFKIEIFGIVKKVNIENREYIEREKIVNEIVNNNFGKHGISYKDESQEEPQKKSGGVYNVDGKIIVIGELPAEDINKLKDNIEGTELSNKLLL